MWQQQPRPSSNQPSTHLAVPDFSGLRVLVAGDAANVAVNVAALGADVAMAAIVGDDIRALVLQNLLDREALRCALLRSVDVPTVHKNATSYIFRQ